MAFFPIPSHFADPVHDRATASADLPSNGIERVAGLVGEVASKHIRFLKELGIFVSFRKG